MQLRSVRINLQLLNARQKQKLVEEKQKRSQL